jgi:ABC-type multidrug transport system fused ATPase/permease subunit
MKHFRFLFQQHWELFLIAVFTGLGASLLEGISVSLIFPILQDVQTKNQPFPFPFNLISGWFSEYELHVRLQIIALLLIIIALTKSLLKYSNTVFNVRMRTASVKHFRMLCFEQHMKLGMGYFNNTKMGDIHTLFTTYSMKLGLFVEEIGIIFPLLFNIIILLSIVMVLSWEMTLTALGFGFFVSLAFRKIMQNAAMTGKALARTTTDFNTTMLELLMATKIIHLFAREQESTDVFESEVDHNNNAMFRTGRLRGMVTPIFEFLAILMLATIMLAGSVLFFEKDSIGLPGLAVFLVIFQRVSGAVMTINQYRVSIIGDWPAFQEIFSFLKSEDKQFLDNGSQQFLQLKKGIELKHVKFSYRETGPPVLKDVSFFIPKGNKVGIVGCSGAGKSTLTELLLRFYEPQAGEIIVDGVDLRLLDVYSWRKHIGVVSQDVFLFNDTIRANITYAMPEATQEEVQEAAHQAYAHDFIMGLPQGYDTMIGDRGVLLSGGQKQRLAIARAIMTQPQILIFDEATSALDTASERIVQNALNKVSEGRTVITIAHRLSTIFDADNIIVMESSCVVEQGRHHELLQKNSVYKELVQIQEIQSPSHPRVNSKVISS